MTLSAFLAVIILPFFRDRLHYLHSSNVVLYLIRIGLPSTVLHYLRRVGRAEEPNLRLLGPASRKIEIPYRTTTG